jgi:hypothetical protein
MSGRGLAPVTIPAGKEVAVSLVQRFERRLESLVGSAFARVFKGQVEPVEIGTALQREATDKRNVMGNGEVLAPNRYRVTLAPSDHERLVPWEVQLTNSLAELLQEHLDENGWRTIGDIEVYLVRDDALHTGVFGVASRMESTAPPRRRPYDSLSLPAVPGDPPDRYSEPYGSGALPGPIPSAGAAAGAAVGAAAGAVAPRFPSHHAQYPPAEPQFPPPAPGYPAPVRSSAQPRPPYPAAAPTGRPHARAGLLIDGTNRHHELRIGSNVVGRGTDSDLQLLDQGVSRRHLDIQYDGTFATVHDLGSTNGTSVNGHDVGSQVLRHGDVIRLGHTRLVYQQEQV